MIGLDRLIELKRGWLWWAAFSLAMISEDQNVEVATNVANMAVALLEKGLSPEDLIDDED